MNLKGFIKVTFINKTIYLYSIESKNQINLNDFQI